jgi:hypothetical protein
MRAWGHALLVVLCIFCNTYWLSCKAAAFLGFSDRPYIGLVLLDPPERIGHALHPVYVHFGLALSQFALTHETGIDLLPHPQLANDLLDLMVEYDRHLPSSVCLRMCREIERY